MQVVQTFFGGKTYIEKLAMDLAVFSLFELLCDIANHRSDNALLGLPISGLDMTQKLCMDRFH